MKKRNFLWVFISLTFIFFLVLIINSNLINSYKSVNQNSRNKDQIQDILSSDSMNININWSPDSKMVAFIKRDTNKLMIWKVKEENAKIIMDNNDFKKFIWSPDSSYLLACTPMGTDVTLFQSTIIKAQDLSPNNYGVVSRYFPVWSFNSKYLVFDGIETDKSKQWSAITAISLETGKAKTLVKSENTSITYQIVYWNSQNIIDYLEIHDEANQNIEKSIVFNSSDF